MKYRIAIVLFILSTLLARAQVTSQILSAEVRFTFVNNDVDGDFDQIENSRLKGSVQVETIKTRNSIRNWSLRRSKYFDVNTYPTITFESTSVQQEGEIILVKGKLTIKDVTKDVNFEFERNDTQLVGKTTLYSSDYGINIKSDREKNKVLVKLVFQLK